MEYDNERTPEALQALQTQIEELGAVSEKIFRLARELNVYKDALEGSVFSIMEDIGQRVINDQRPELGELINLLLNFNEQKSRLKPTIKLTLSASPDGKVIMIAEL